MVQGFLNYLTQEKRLSQHTVISYRNDLSQLKSFLSCEFDMDLAGADDTHLRSWVIHLSEAGLSSVSINRKIACAKSFYKYLVFRGYIETNPSRFLKPLKKEKKLPEFVAEEDVIQLLDQVSFDDTFQSQRDRLLLELLYATGIRLTELIRLKETDVSEYDRTIKVLGKRNKERILPLHVSLINMIAHYKMLKRMEGLHSEYLLVTNKGKALYPMFVYRKVKAYLSLVTTISKKSPHVIRHTFATHLLNKGAALNAVKDLLGHTSLAATQVYTHNSIEKLKKTFDQAHPKA